MGYEPLHHKYRPQTFADLVGQEAIASTLTNALAQERIAPAYLFTGARGTGKTSSARIMAKSLNCISFDKPTATPCGTCSMCREITRGTALDITEIDAASNTGVDNIRELIERSQFAPVLARYKVYVIDEVHMLSNAAFNALLKTLEEPPDRVTFILATTDPQRVLPTIISRCQKFDFRRIPLDSMVKHLAKIAQIEKIDIHAEALTLVGQIAQGGLRDAESLLDQLSLLEGEISVEAVWELVGSVPEKDLLGLIESISTNNSTQTIDLLRRVMDRGREPLIVLQNLAGMYRDLLIAKTAGDRQDLVAMTSSGWEGLKHQAANLSIEVILAGQQHLRSAEVQIKNTTQPRLWLEVTLMGLLPISIESNRVQTVSAPSSVRTETRSSPQNPEPRIQPQVQQVVARSEVMPEMSPEPTTGSIVDRVAENPVESISQPTTQSTTQLANPSLESAWQELMSYLSPAPKGLLHDHAQFIDVNQTTARIGLKNPTFKKIAEQKREEVEECCSRVFDRPIKVTFEVLKGGSTAKKSQTPTSSSPASGAQTSSRAQPTSPSASPNSHTNSPTKASSNPSPKPPSSEPKSPDQVNQAYMPKSPDVIAALNVAKFFDGEIVNLDDEPSE